MTTREFEKALENIEDGTSVIITFNNGDSPIAVILRGIQGESTPEYFTPEYAKVETNSGREILIKINIIESIRESLN